MIQKLITYVAIGIAAAYCLRLLWLGAKTVLTGYRKRCAKSCDCEIRKRLEESGHAPAAERRRSPSA